MSRVGDQILVDMPAELEAYVRKNRFVPIAPVIIATHPTTLSVPLAKSYVLPPQRLVAKILCLLVRQSAVIDLRTVDGSVKLAPKTVEKMRMLRKTLLVGLKIVRQIRRKIAFVHVH